MKNNTKSTLKITKILQVNKRWFLYLNNKHYSSAYKRFYQLELERLVIIIIELGKRTTALTSDFHKCRMFGRIEGSLRVRGIEVRHHGHINP